MIQVAIAAGDDVLAQPPERPYPGLRPFEPCEWMVFFGRERMVDEVVARLVNQQFVVVHGDSGSGKSSLISAGVLPRLVQEGARGGIVWSTCVCAPGDAPLANFARALAALHGGERTDEIRRALNFGRHAAEVLSELLRRPDEHVCLLVDQFEELFAFAKRSGAHEARMLVEVLIGLQERRGLGLYVVLTMRSEFLGACAKFEGFAEVVNATQYLLPRMGHADLVRAIREPASLYDGSVSMDLAERLISDAFAHQDQLPLIAHGLMLLHRQALAKSRPDQPWKLEVQDYERLGHDLADALSAHADQTAQAAVAACRDPVAAEAVLEDIFRALTDINADGQAIRRPQALRELVAVTGRAEQTVRTVVDAFRAEGASLLRPHGSGVPLSLDDRVDISHEALIRCWKRIADPENGWLIREFKNGLIWRSLLVQAESFERDPSHLLSPAATDERAAWLERRHRAWSERYGGGWKRVRGLIDASLSARDRQRSEEELERRQAEEQKLREQQLWHESRRARMYRFGFFIALALVVAVVTLAFRAHQERRSAEVARLQAEGARLQAEMARGEMELQLEQTKRIDQDAAEQDQALEDIRSTLLAALQRLPATEALPSSNLHQLLAETRSSLSTEVQKIDGAAKVAPRLYVHISEEAQRAAARELTARLVSANADHGPLIVPGIELKRSDHTELRCFDVDDCQDASALLRAIDRALVTPSVGLQDLTEKYANAKLRERHYELWFAAGDIQLEPERGPASAKD